MIPQKKLHLQFKSYLFTKLQIIKLIKNWKKLDQDLLHMIQNLLWLKEDQILEFRKYLKIVILSLIMIGKTGKILIFTQINLAEIDQYLNIMHLSIEKLNLNRIRGDGYFMMWIQMRLELNQQKIYSQQEGWSLKNLENVRNLKFCWRNI